MSGSYYLRTFGCQMNEHDSERIAGLLDSAGMTRTEDPATANVVVFNTCAIRENADNRLYGHLGDIKRLKQTNPDLRVVVAGCLAQKDKDAVFERAPWVDMVVGPHALSSVLDGLRPSGAAGRRVEVGGFSGVFPSDLPAQRATRYHAWVCIAVGCDNACSYCIVPTVRGPQHSRPMQDVLAEVRELVGGGVVEVTLLGQNVNTFGRDATVPGSGKRALFAGLLREVDAVEGLRRIRFTSPHPHDFTPDVIEAMAGCRKLCEHIHLPLQAGSDRMLKAMQRSYRSAGYLELLGRIREAVPGIAVSTDVIVGFPGETDRDFEDTLGIVREARFDSAFTFRFSPRPGTRAAGMAGRVPDDVVQERFERLVASQEAISLEKNAELVGRSVEVLVEGRGRKGLAQGRTRTNRIVHFEGDPEPGEFLEVRVTAAHPHHLSAERLSSLAPR